MQWKLIHTNQRECIENEGGKTLSYNPNLGIKIMEKDGYAFKDLNDNGELDPFEDWRLPLTTRVQDFCTRFHIWQEEDFLYYKKGKIEFPRDFCQLMTSYQQQESMCIFLDVQQEDMSYLNQNSILSMMLLMFDNDFDTGREDYLLQIMVQSIDLGVLENIVYSIIEALKKFVEHRTLLRLHPSRSL